MSKFHIAGRSQTTPTEHKVRKVIEVQSPAPIPKQARDSIFLHSILGVRVTNVPIRSLSRGDTSAHMAMRLMSGATWTMR